jgi:hypothetical protein
MEQRLSAKMFSTTDPVLAETGSHGQWFPERGLFPWLYELTVNLKNGFAVATTLRHLATLTNPRRGGIAWS